MSELETAEQWRDEVDRMRRAIEILEASASRPLTIEERSDLAYEAGLGSVYKESK